MSARYFSAVRERLRDRLTDVQARAGVGDLLPQRPQALDHRRLADEVGAEDADDALVVDLRQRRRLRRPLGERLARLVRELVVRPRPRHPGLAARREVAELLEPLRLGVVLALRPGAVDAALPRHAHEVVRAGAAVSDQDEHGVRERIQVLT